MLCQAALGSGEHVDGGKEKVEVVLRVRRSHKLAEGKTSIFLVLRFAHRLDVNVEYETLSG